MNQDNAAGLITQPAVARQDAIEEEPQLRQKTLPADEQHYRLLFENAPLGIFEVDISEETPRIRAANRRAEAIFGWSGDEFASLDSFELIPDKSRQEIQQLVETVRAGKVVMLETANRRKDGTHFPARIIATPAWDQRGMHVIVVVEDISAQRERRSGVEAIDEERRRIAQEIHDGVAQDLAALRLKLALWRDWVASDPARMQEELDQAQAMLDTAIDGVRRSIYALRPVALDEAGLVPAVRRYIAEFSQAHNIYVDLQIELPQEHLPPAIELLLFRVAQEALANISRHAGASLAWVRLGNADGSAVQLTIRDNGRGFDPVLLAHASRSGHLGLKQMRERIEKVGGELSLASQPGRGTQIHVCLPLDD